MLITVDQIKDDLERVVNRYNYMLMMNINLGSLVQRGKVQALCELLKITFSDNHDWMEPIDFNQLWGLYLENEKEARINY